MLGSDVRGPRSAHLIMKSSDYQCECSRTDPEDAA
jgi:hypothetical protein